MKWKKYRISDVIDIIGGGTPKTSVAEYWDGDIPWLSVKDFNDDYRTVSKTEKTITKKGLENSSTKLLKKGDLIISARGTVGALAQLGKDMAFNQSCYGLRANKDSENTFLYYLLKNELGQILSNTHGSVFDTITRETFESLKAFIPPLPEQRAIAEILSSIDDKIELNNQMNRTLEAMAQAIFKQWFVDFEFPQKSKASDSQNPLLRGEGGPLAVGEVKMIDSELGPIPEGWRVGVFNDLVEDIIDNRGKTPPLEQEGIIMIEGNSIINDYSFPVFSNTAKLKYVSEYTYNNWFRDGHPEYLDILCATVGSLPKWCFMPKNKKICIAQNIVAIRSKNNSSPFYLKCFMNSEYFIESFNGRIVTTAQPSIKIGHLTSIPIIVPSDFIMKSFGELVKPLYELIENKIEENQTLSALRDSLLPKLMSGELRVPEEIVKRYENV